MIIKKHKIEIKQICTHLPDKRIPTAQKILLCYMIRCGAPKVLHSQSLTHIHTHGTWLSRVVGPRAVLMVMLLLPYIQNKKKNHKLQAHTHFKSRFLLFSIEFFFYKNNTPEIPALLQSTQLNFCKSVYLRKRYTVRCGQLLLIIAQR